MSSISGGGSDTFDKLLILAEFVKSPDFQGRVKQLRDLEASSQKALEQSENARDELEAAKRTHELDKRAHQGSVDRLTADREAFDRRKAKVDKAIAALHAALRDE